VGSELRKQPNEGVRQQERWDLRDDLRSITSLARFRGCGRKRIAAAVTVRMTAGKAGYVGLQTCGSVWVCPVCAAKIATVRGLELAAGTDRWLSDPTRSIVFPTNTARHNAGDRLAPLLDAVVKSWGSVTNSKAWVTDREQLGIAGYSRAVEVLHNVRNGWHPHNHSLIFSTCRLTEDQVERFGERVYRRWNASLERRGYSSLPVGQSFELVNAGSDPAVLGRYLAKMPETATSGRALGFEMTSTQTKGARSIGRTQWQLAESAVAGDARDQRLWREFERATKGRRQLTWSQGMRDRLELNVEQSDDEIAAEVLGSDVDNVAMITAAGWSTICGHAGLAITLLHRLQQSYAEFRSTLDLFGVEYVILPTLERSAA
jgi:hypothetical protein